MSEEIFEFTLANECDLQMTFQQLKWYQNLQIMNRSTALLFEQS